MIKVETYNYEAFYLDYLEGNLNAQEIEALQQFLKDHPECAEEVEGMEDILDFELVEDQIVFEDKTSLMEPVLKNGVQLNNVENWMIGSVEGLLSENENRKLLEFVQKNELGQTYNLYQNIKLRPNLKIVFENKKSLLKKNAIVFTMYARIMTLAAVLTLIFLAVNWNNKQNKNQQYSMRENFASYIPSDTSAVEKIIQIKETSLESNHSTGKYKNKQSNKKGPSKILVSPLENLKPLPELANNYYPNIAAVQPIPELATYDEFFTMDDFAMFEYNPVNEEQFANSMHAHHEASKLSIQTKYQPVTNALSNITKLPVSYQESTKDSDYKVTKFKIGKISFERKKKK